jgi:LuxR family transcriptional regulator, maltose regulon positive regulatory protein
MLGGPSGGTCAVPASPDDVRSRRTVHRVGVPAPPAVPVVRPRLLALVEEGVEGSLTLLSAPAGTGKSVLVSIWARTTPTEHPLVWLPVTREGGAQLVWHELPGALRQCGIEVSVRGLPANGSPPGEQWLSRLAAAVRAHPEPVVLVLDEGDAVADPVLHRSLATLIRRADGALRIILITRSDPVLPLNSYRLADQLTEIRAADLSFDQSEATQLFDNAGLSLTATQTASLVRRTSGWAVGLRLAAMGVHGRSDVDGAVADFSGNQDNVSTYLAAEVLAGQPAPLAEVLLRTSVVDAISPGLFEALTGLENGQSVMGFTARGNSFIEAVPDYPGWYRYQSLFREFLRARLEREHPQLARELHRTAAGWFARNGFLTMAVRHAGVVGAWGDAARYLIDDLSIGALLGEVWSTGQSSAFADLPPDEPGTPAAIVRAAVALATTDEKACEGELAHARTLLAQAPESDTACALSIALLETLLAVVRADVSGGLASAHAAEQQLRGNFPEAARSRPELAMLIGLSRARLQLSIGDLANAADTLSRVSSAGGTAESQRLGLAVLGLRALVEGLREDLVELVRVTDAAVELARSVGLDEPRWPWELLLSRSWVLIERLELEAAAELLALAAPSARGTVGAPIVALVEARLVDARVGPLAAARPGSRASGHGPLIDPLTPKELEVLGHLAELLSTAEIADTMFVSSNTVRTHVRNILRKLSAARRNDAVRRAWELGLLVPPRGDGWARRSGDSSGPDESGISLPGQTAGVEPSLDGRIT